MRAGLTGMWNKRVVLMVTLSRNSKQYCRHGKEKKGMESVLDDGNKGDETEDKWHTK